MAGDIPGFYTDIDTGRPGPKVLILGEMDALIAPGHPEAVNGNAHACGHNAQCAALVGTALALRSPVPWTACAAPSVSWRCLPKN